MAWRRRLRWLERGALIIGLLCLGLWARAQLRSWAFQSAESKKLATARREVVPAPAGTPGPEVSRERRTRATTKKPAKSARPVAAIGRIEIPRLRIQAMVAEGTDARTLDLAVGHIASTAPPGSPGNCGLAGHRDTFFSGLGGVRAGDLVRFSSRERTYTYEVQWSRVVDPDRVDTLDPTPVPSLTLVTCYPFTYVGRAPQRFVVRARQVDAPDPPAAARIQEEHGPTVLMAAGR